MKLKLGIITLLSALHDPSKVENSHYNFISGLKKSFDIAFIDPEETDGVDLPVVFIGSGGTENYFRNIYDKLPKPVLLLTDGVHNSLAAAMEILAWIKELGDDSLIIHGSIQETTAQLEYCYKAVNARKQLKEAAIGVVGFPSDWLIASDVSYIEARRKWGVLFKNIELQELKQQFSRTSLAQAKEVAEAFIKNSAGLKEAEEKDVIEAARLY
jgi:L-fucose isomerase-like protein